MGQSKRKIIYLVTQSEWGGAQEYVYNLATNLDKNQAQPLVLAGADNAPLPVSTRSIRGERSRENEASELFTALEAQNIAYKQLKWAKRAINPVFDLLALFELIFVFKSERPDVIHLNSSKIGFLGSLAARMLIGTGRPRVVYTAHGWVFNEPLPYLIKKLYYFIEKKSSAWKDVIICVSEADRQTALANNFKAKIITIHNAVDPAQLDFFDQNAARQKLWELLDANGAPRREPAKLIGAIANLYPTKGVNYLIMAAARLVKTKPDLIFMVMGQGQERPNLEALIINHHLENNFFLLGSVPQAHQYLKALDLFVLPSVKEGLPYAILKAQAAEIPIMAAKVGALPEIMPAELLAEPGNADDLAEKINDALNNPDKYRLPSKTDFNEFLKQTFSHYS